MNRSLGGITGRSVWFAQTEHLLSLPEFETQSVQHIVIINRCVCVCVRVFLLAHTHSLQSYCLVVVVAVYEHLVHICDV